MADRLYTTNINLVKPLQNENYNVDDFNNNAEKIDAAIGEVQSGKSDKLVTGANIKLTEDEESKTIEVAVTGTVPQAEKDKNGNAIDTTYAPLKSPQFTENPTAPTQTVNDNSTKLATTAFMQKEISDGNHFVVSVGTLNHGETIPLPQGFTQEQCKWTVSMNSDNPTGAKWDIDESGSYMHYRFECWANSDRTVHAITFHNSAQIPAIANYMIIGIK